MKIGNRSIGLNHQPFVVAEMSGNHNQSLERALEIVELAAKAGAHGLKLQTYTPDTITINCKENEFFIKDKDNLWEGKSLYELYEEAQTPWEWHKPIFKRSRELGLIPFSSPFDLTSVDFLEDLDVPCYKIASFENIDIELIKKVASTKKPMIISTGMANLAELDEAVAAARNAGCKDLILLKCTSSYPASPEYSNILTIPHMRDLFKCEIGISDHTYGIGVSVAAVALGATITAATSMSSSVLASTPKKGGTLRLAMSSGTTTDILDMSVSTGATSELVHGYAIYNNIIEIGADGSVVPELVDTMETDDAKTWRFKLRKGVEWHNGKSLDVNDLICSVNHHRGEDSKSSIKGLSSALPELGNEIFKF